MCHSVEMYLPRMTRAAAEHRIGQADLAAAGRERRLVDAGAGLIGRIARIAGFLAGNRSCTRARLLNILKNKRNLFERDVWLGEHESRERREQMTHG